MMESPLATTIYEHSAPVTQNQPNRLWLVEDDLMLGQELACLLQQLGFDVRHFARMDEAERAARDGRPDALILDVMLADEGINSTMQLQDTNGLHALDCPLIFISSTDDFSSRVRAAQLGAEGYLLKPLDVPRLIDHLEHVLKGSRASPQRVMIVDDDASRAEHFRLLLLAAGMEVEVLDNPEDIIRRMTAFHPELVLMDVHMPSYSGIDLAGVIRQYDRWINLPIVYLSIESDLERHLQVMARMADNFLSKPIADHQLVIAIRVHIERARQLAELINVDSLLGC